MNHWGPIKGPLKTRVHRSNMVLRDLWGDGGPQSSEVFASQTTESANITAHSPKSMAPVNQKKKNIKKKRKKNSPAKIQSRV